MAGVTGKKKTVERAGGGVLDSSRLEVVRKRGAVRAQKTGDGDMSTRKGSKLGKIFPLFPTKGN